MANNIQIVGNITNTNNVNRYSQDDISLIGIQNIQAYFDPNNDYIEYYIYDAGGNLLSINYDYKEYKLPTDSALTPSYTPPPNSKDQITNSDLGAVNPNTSDTGSSYTSVEIDPIKNLQQLGYNSGEFKVQYNFFKNRVGSPNNEYFLKRISGDRTEISITSTTLTNTQIEQDANSLINELNNSPYFFNYLVNFGLNQQSVAVNVALDKIEAGYEILFKLYEPLPSDIVEKNTLWVVEEKVNPYVFDINLDALISPNAPLMLRGANFNIPISREINTISTQYGNYSNIVNSVQNSQTATYQKLLNTLTSSSIAINVDYSDYNNFAFFGSVEQRLNNFYSKVKQIEDYNNLITAYSASASFNPNLQLEINRYTASIDSIIYNFDGYETYLYFESSSYTWPKSTSTLPYTLYPTGSTSGSEWFTANIASASLFDETNQNNLQNGIPTYLINNPDNNQYLLFLNMIGQYFDNIWIMLKSVTDVNVANNNLEEGVSKDLVYQVLKSFGIDLYNSLEGDDLTQYIVGNNTGSAYLSGSLVDFSPTSSYLNNIPKRDLVAEVYKRIYHNLPLLVKAKGTTAGLQNIVTMFGVTSSILNVKEYGGESKAEYLKGYSSNKVRLGNINPLENVLSPITSIQQIPSSSTDYLDNDLQYVDISFSPQNQIDLYISQSISSNNSTFDMDDYIGDPRQQYSTTYPDLDNQRKIYFEQGTGSYAGFTSSYLDYNGFIRLIQFFDNSLFKTLEAFTPLRTSLSTGITFNSPVLERNKFAYANPSNSTTESIKEAEITSGSIGSEYGFLYDNLAGDKSPYYSGEISGSKVDLYNSYFIPANENPYLGNINVWNSQHDADEQISLSQFALSDYNVLFNNVSSSRLSEYRKTLELVQPVYVTELITGSKASFTLRITKSQNNEWEILNNQVLSATKSGSIALSMSLVNNELIYGDALELYNGYAGDIFGSNWTTYFDIDSSGVDTNNLVLTFTAKQNGISYNLTNFADGDQMSLTNYVDGIDDILPTTVPAVYVSSSAELQDSYLSLISYKNPRYDGVKIKSSTYNQYTAGDSGSYGKTSAIDKYQAYFLTFKEIRNAYPELIGKSTLWINSLVDKDGRQLAVSYDTSSNYYNNLIDNFGKDSNVNLQITTVPSGTIANDLDQSTTIYRPAMLWPSVILTNESGSTFNYNTNTPSFATRDILLAPTGSSTNLLYYTTLKPIAKTFNVPVGASAGSPGYYRFSFLNDFNNSTLIERPTSWSLSADQTYGDAIIVPPPTTNILSYAKVEFNVTTPPSYDIYIKIVLTIKSETNPSDYKSVDSGWIFKARAQSNSLTSYTFNDIKLLPGYKIVVALAYYSNPTAPALSTPTPSFPPLSQVDFTVSIGGEGATIEIGALYASQYTLPKNVFSVDSNYPTFLISSANYQNLYGLNLVQLNDTGDYGGVGGYDAIIENFNPIVGDEIRFNQNESISLNIMRIEENIGLQRIVFELNRALTTSEIGAINSLADGFLIRRNTVDPSKLVINAPKLVGGASGYLTPQYMTPELATNLDGVVETLKENGIL